MSGPVLPARIEPQWRAAVRLAAIFWFCLPSAQGQALHELVPIVLERDAGLEAARLESQSTQWRVRQSEAARLPTWSARASATANLTQNKAVVPVHGRSRELQLALQAQHSLFNRADEWAVEVARRQLAQARQQEEAARRDLTWRLTLAYVEVLAARDALRVLTQARRTVAQQVVMLSRMLAAGAATVSDVRDAQGRLDLAAAQEQVAIGELRARRSALDQVVGQDGVVVRPIALLGKLGELDLGGQDDWAARAREASSEAAVARLALEIARAEAQRVKAQGQMTASLTANVGGGYGTNATRTAAGDEVLSSQGRGAQHVAGISLNLNVPLDASSALEWRQREALTQVARWDAQLRSALQASDTQVRQAHIALSSLRQQMRSLQAAEQSSGLALEAAERGLRAGLRVSIDVLNAQSQVFAIRRDHVRVRYEALITWLRLQHLMGQLGESELRALRP